MPDMPSTSVDPPTKPLMSVGALGVGVEVCVGVGVCVGVQVIVGVLVAVLVWVGVAVGGAGVRVLVCVGEPVGVDVGRQPICGLQPSGQFVSVRWHIPATQLNCVHKSLGGQSPFEVQPAVGVCVAVWVGVAVGDPPHGRQPQLGSHIPGQFVSVRWQVPSTQVNCVHASVTPQSPSEVQEEF
jgi:hypothetical protein